MEQKRGNIKMRGEVYKQFCLYNNEYELSTGGSYSRNSHLNKGGVSDICGVLATGGEDQRISVNSWSK